MSGQLLFRIMNSVSQAAPTDLLLWSVWILRPHVPDRSEPASTSQCTLHLRGFSSSCLLIRSLVAGLLAVAVALEDCIVEGADVESYIARLHELG